MQPSEPGSASVGSLSGNARAGIAVLCIGFGLFICAAAARWIDVQPAPGVPHWLVGLAGAIFVLAGIAVALPQRPTRVQDFVGALLFTAFAAMGLWIGFGPGDRRFSGSWSFGPIAGGESSAIVGRLMFGAMGVLVAVIALYAWRRVFRHRAAANRSV